MTCDLQKKLNLPAAQRIPNVDVFFDSLVRVIHGARSHLSTDDTDSAVFWSCRLDEYERTLTLLLSRVAESIKKLSFEIYRC